MEALVLHLRLHHWSSSEHTLGALTGPVPAGKLGTQNHHAFQAHPANPGVAKLRVLASTATHAPKAPGPPSRRRGRSPSSASIASRGLTLSHRISIRALSLAFGLIAAGDDSEVTETSGAASGFENAAAAGRSLVQSRQAGRVYHCGEFVALEKMMAVCRTVHPTEPLAVGNPSFMLQGDAAGREIGNTVFGWSLIGEVGAYTVHQSVRLRIRGPTFTVLHEDSYIR